MRISLARSSDDLFGREADAVIDHRHPASRARIAICSAPLEWPIQSGLGDEHREFPAQLCGRRINLFAQRADALVVARRTGR